MIKKINFFNKKYSYYYGTTSYSHKAYYSTNDYILNGLPKYFISSLAQFIAITPLEIQFLVKLLNKKKNKLISTGEWLTHVIMKSVTIAHNTYNGSMFSEYELIGQSNLKLNYKRQILISGLRDHLNGKLTYFQIKILEILGFKYIAYEHTHSNNNSRNMLSRNQSWRKFLYLLLKKQTNNMFRGAKHHVFYTLNFFKPTKW